MKEFDASYLEPFAKLVDIYGFIGIKKTSPRYTPRTYNPFYRLYVVLRVPCTEKDMIVKFHEVFGGHLKQDGIIYFYTAYDRQAEQILLTVYNLLRKNHKRAKVALDFAYTKRQGYLHKTKQVGTRRFVNVHGIEYEFPVFAYSDEFVAQLEHYYVLLKEELPNIKMDSFFQFDGLNRSLKTYS